jgi:predicted  nucleic acid-binding Zn-ribbon protein
MTGHCAVVAVPNLLTRSSGPPPGRGEIAMDFLDAYIERREAELDELDAEMKTFEFRMSNVQPDQQSQVYDDLQVLRGRYSKARQTLSELQHAKRGQAVELKEELEMEWKELENGMQRARQCLESPPPDGGSGNTK